jgi:hypothetical protein
MNSTPRDDRLAGGLNANLSTKGMNGTVRSEISDVTVNRDDNWTRYSARIGEGGPEIELRGINGNVRLTSARSVADTQTSADKTGPSSQKDLKSTESRSLRSSVQ